MQPSGRKAPRNDVSRHGLGENMAGRVVKPLARQAQLLEERLVMRRARQWQAAWCEIRLSRQDLVKACPRPPRQEGCDASDQTVGFISLTPGEPKLTQHIAEENSRIRLCRQKIGGHIKEIAPDPLRQSGPGMEALEQGPRPAIRIDDQNPIKPG